MSASQAVVRRKASGGSSLGLRVVAANRTLSQLAVDAEKQYRLATESASHAVAHAIACGDVLLVAQAQVPPGQWGRWCRANVPTINETTIQKFCRLAAHKDAIATGEFPTIERAMGYLRALGVPPRPSGPMRSYKTFDHDEARRLLAKGKTYKEVGEILGVSDQTIALHLNPTRMKQKKDYMRRISREKRAAKNALIVQQRDKTIRSTGGLPAEAYALLRRTALVIDKAIGKTEDSAEKVKLTAALGFVHKAEDEIVRALRLERSTPPRPQIIKRKTRA